MKIYDASLAGTVTTVSGSTSNLTGSFSGSFSGSHIGNGSGLFNIPASGVTGLELNKIVDGGTNATISATQGLRVNTDTTITGSLTVTGNLTAQQFIVSSSVTHLTTSFSSGSTKFGDTIDDTHQFTGSVLISGSQNITGSLNVSGSLNVNNSLYVTSNDKVGVGTTSPGLNLSVQGLYGLPLSSSAQTVGIFRVQDSASNIALDMGVIQNFGNWIQSINKVNSSALTLALNPNGGNVGIGTSTPSGISTYTTLDIRGATGGGIRMGVSSSSTPFNLQQAGTDAYLNNVANGSIIFYTNDTLRAQITSTGVFQPGANGTQDLGTTSLRWGTIYTSDLSLSNGIGDYTIVEGEEKLYLYNNKNNKVYSFVLQEEDPLTATPKKS
jgi:hypothetical protein